MKLSRFVTGFVAVALMAFMVSDALAQGQGQGQGRGGRGGPPGGFQGRGGPGGPGGPGFGGFGGRGGGDMTMALLRVEEVQKELEVSSDQKAALEKLAEQSRSERPDFANFRDMSEADRTAAFEKMRKQAEELTTQVREELLLPNQVERLDEIAMQVRGVQALDDDAVAKKLNITADQKAKFAEVREAQGAKMREMFQAGGGPGNFDREAFGKLREQMEKDLLAVLDSGQQAKFEELKGEKFEMPEGAFGRGGPGGPGGFGGPGGPGGGPGGPGGRGSRGGRPQPE